MKKLFYILPFAVLVAVGCNNAPEEEVTEEEVETVAQPEPEPEPTPEPAVVKEEPTMKVEGKAKPAAEAGKGGTKEATKKEPENAVDAKKQQNEEKEAINPIEAKKQKQQESQEVNPIEAKKKKSN